MEEGKLRKADIFSGTLILVLGLFIIGQGLQMPMKDSWGGVQNVWFVSPALFPLFVGSMLALLGGILISIALKSVGLEGVRSVFRYFGSWEFTGFLRNRANIRFYGVVFNLIMFVFLMIPRVDFFLAAFLFLLTFFFMYYLGDHQTLTKIFTFVIVAYLLLALFLLFGIAGKFKSLPELSGDYLTIAILAALCIRVGALVGGDPERKRRYRLSLLIGFLAPLTVGVIFKYFLLVPMPFEGIIVQLMDAVWYADFWSL